MGVWAALKRRVVGPSPSGDLHGVALAMEEGERELYAAYDGVREAMRGADTPSWPGAAEAWDRLLAVLDRLEPALREALTTGVGESVLRLRLVAVASLRRACRGSRGRRGHPRGHVGGRHEGVERLPGRGRSAHGPPAPRVRPSRAVATVGRSRCGGGPPVLIGRRVRIGGRTQEERTRSQDWLRGPRSGDSILMQMAISALAGAADEAHDRPRDLVPRPLARVGSSGAASARPRPASPAPVPLSGEALGDAGSNPASDARPAPDLRRRTASMALQGFGPSVIDP
jgi:hypothetical protein